MSQLTSTMELHHLLLVYHKCPLPAFAWPTRSGYLPAHQAAIGASINEKRLLYHNTTADTQPEAHDDGDTACMFTALGKEGKLRHSARKVQILQPLNLPNLHGHSNSALAHDEELF